MVCLAIDTSGNACSVALYDIGRGVILNSTSEALGRGHAERILPMIQQCIKDSEYSLSHLSKICVTRGPGSFTGVRVGLATARGLGLALGVPVVGVSNLEVLEFHAGQLCGAGEMVTILDAHRSQVFVKYPESFGVSADDIVALSTAHEVASRLQHHFGPVCGSGAEEVRDLLDNPKQVKLAHSLATAPIEVLAAYGCELEPSSNPPSAFYLREPDAKPQSAFTGVVKI